MAIEQWAMLVADIGTATTKLTLVDLVDGTFRLIARAETGSTVEAPEANAAAAVLQLAATLEALTGRRLCQDNRLLTPPDGLGNGVVTLVVTTSAAPPLPVVVAGLSAQQSTRAAVAAARGTYVDLQHVFALDEAGSGAEQWLGDQVAALATADPSVVLIAGGLDGGAVAPVLRVAEIVALLTRYWRKPPRIIYAGNSDAGEQVRAVLDMADVDIVDNVRPSTVLNRVEPARRLVQAIFGEQCLPALPGFDMLRELRARYVGIAAHDQAIAVRYVAERFGRNVLALDVGATHTLGHLMARDHFSQVVLAGVGVGRGAIELAELRGLPSIQRWLPFERGPAELRNLFLNRAIGPAAPSTTIDELLVDYALAREAVAAAVEALAEARHEVEFDLMVAGGFLARAPLPGTAALALLDGLPLELLAQKGFAVDLYLDTFGLLSSAGALAHIEPDAAATLLEQDMLTNGPLATVVVPNGALVPGVPAVEVELAGGGHNVRRVVVNGDEIRRLPVSRGESCTLRIRPAPGIAIGNNMPGTEVHSEEGAIVSSLLGVVVDARRRPLSALLIEGEAPRLVQQWLAALDALPVETHPVHLPALAAEPVEPPETTTLPADGEQSVEEQEPPVAVATTEAEPVPATVVTTADEPVLDRETTPGEKPAPDAVDLDYNTERPVEVQAPHGEHATAIEMQQGSVTVESGTNLTHQLPSLAGKGEQSVPLSAHHVASGEGLSADIDEALETQAADTVVEPAGGVELAKEAGEVEPVAPQQIGDGAATHATDDLPPQDVLHAVPPTLDEQPKRRRGFFRRR